MNAGGGVRAGHPSRTAVTGPLAPYADGFREDLVGQGYAQHSISGQMGLMAHLSVWLDSQDLPVGGLTAEVVEGYLRVRRGAGHRTGITRRAVAPLLGYLRGLRVVAESVRQVPGTPVEVVLEEFRVYLVDERGLAPASVHGYLRYARMFVTGLSAPLGTALAELSTGQVTAFLVRQSGLRSTWRLIQDSTIDLVRPILSCNDQTSIKIAE
jgi:integrase/recombinase XerD